MIDYERRHPRPCRLPRAVDYFHPTRPRTVRPDSDGVVRLTRPGDSVTLTARGR